MRREENVLTPEEIRAWRLWQYAAGVTIEHWGLVFAVTAFVLSFTVWVILGITDAHQAGSSWRELKEIVERRILLPQVALLIGIVTGWLLERRYGLLKAWEDRWDAFPPWFYRFIEEKERRRIIPWFVTMLIGICVFLFVWQLADEGGVRFISYALLGLSIGLGIDALQRLAVMIRDSPTPPREKRWQQRIAFGMVPFTIRMWLPWVVVGGLGGFMLVAFSLSMHEPNHFWFGMMGVPVGLLLAWVWTRKRSPLLDQLRWQRVVRDVGRVLAGIALLLMVPLWGGGPEMEAVAAGLAGFLVGYVAEEEKDGRKKIS